MEISTVTDAFEDFMENDPAFQNQNNTFKKALSGGKIVYSGIGDVNLHDVAIAKAANGVIVCFNVGVEKHARKECDVSWSLFS